MAKTPKRPGKKAGKGARQQGNSPAIKKAAAPPRPPGRPPFIPTETEKNLVKLAVAIGFTKEQIGRLVRPGDGGVSGKTIQRHFAAELAMGREWATMAVANRLFATANSNLPAATTAAIFWLKAVAGWRDRDPIKASASVAFGEGVGESDGDEGPPQVPGGRRLRITLALGQPKDNLTDDDDE